MRTFEDIVERIKNRSSIFGFDAEAIIDFLPFDQAKQFLKEGVKEEDWKTVPLTREGVLDKMRDYMDFAWEKAENHRGISASRSVEKMGVWLWLLGDDELLKQFEDTPYTNYGVPKLMFICQKFGFPFPDNQEVKNMAEGLPCAPGCNGCGH